MSRARTEEERAALAEQRTARRSAAIKAIVAQAPPLTTQQIITLRRIFAGTAGLTATAPAAPATDESEAA